MRSKEKPDFVKLLNYNLSYNPVFENLYKATSKILDEHIGEPLSQLDRIRSSQHVKRGDFLDVETARGIERAKVADVKLIREDDGTHRAKITLGLGNGTAVVVEKEILQDRKTLINQAAFAGADYYSDYISDVEYARLVDYVGSYWKHQNSGEQNFIDFIGFIKGMRLSLIQLWTRDQGDYATNPDEGFNFYEYLIPEEDVVDPFRFEGNASAGTEYLTSHVDLEYDVIVSPNVGFNDLINLFYYFAPIELVLNRIIGGINVQTETYGNIAAHIDSNLLSRYEWTPNIVLNANFTTPISQIDLNFSTYLFLDNYFEETEPYYPSYSHEWKLTNRIISRTANFSINSLIAVKTSKSTKVLFNSLSKFYAKSITNYGISQYNSVSTFDVLLNKHIHIGVDNAITSSFTTEYAIKLNYNSNYDGISNYNVRRTNMVYRTSNYSSMATITADYGTAFDIDYDYSYR